MPFFQEVAFDAREWPVFSRAFLGVVFSQVEAFWWQLLLHMMVCWSLLEHCEWCDWKSQAMVHYYMGARETRRSCPDFSEQYVTKIRDSYDLTCKMHQLSADIGMLLLPFLHHFIARSLCDWTMLWSSSADWECLCSVLCLWCELFCTFCLVVKPAYLCVRWFIAG